MASPRIFLFIWTVILALGVSRAVAQVNPDLQPLYDAFHMTHPTYVLPNNLNPSLTQLIAGLEAQSQAQPNDASAFYQLGLAYAENKQYDKAADALNQALTLKPDDKLILLNLGCADALRNANNESVVDFRKLTDLDRTNVEAFINYTVILMRTTDLDNAEVAIDHALEVNPESKEAWNVKGLLSGQQKMFDLGNDAFRHAIKIDPNYALPWVSIGGTEAFRGHVPDAVEALTHAISLDPNLQVSWSWLEQTYTNAKDLDNGKKTFEELLKQHPEVAAGWCNLGNLEDNLNDPAEALPNVQKATDLDPKYSGAWDELGFVLVHLNQPDKATEAFTQSIKINPKDAEGWNDVGYSQLLANKYDAAVGSFNMALKINPRHQRALVNLANTYATMGNQELARETVTRIEYFNPQLAAELRKELHL